MSPKPIHLVLFFTWDVSLKLWSDKGLLQREVLYYQKLADQGIKITFVTWGNDEDIVIGQSIHPNINILPLYTQLPYSQKKYLRAIFSLLVPWKLRHILRTTSIIKTNQMWGSWVATISKIFFRKPLIVRTGFELYNFTILQKQKFQRRLFIKIISLVAYKCSDLIYLATEQDKKFVEKNFSVLSKKIQVRPNWIDINLFKPLDIDEHINSIIYVGRLNAQKNLPLLIEAISNTDWTLNIVGAGELADSCKVLANKVNAKVNFHGNIPNNKLPEIYHRSSIFALVSHYEGNPKSLLEAMSCGRAVLGTNVEGINSVITHQKNGLLCEPSVESVKEALHLLMGNHLLREKLGAAARNHILGTHSLEMLIAKEIADYYSLLNLR